VAGTWGAEFAPEVAPQADDLVVTKHRYSAFFATDLDMLLRARGIRTIVLSGTATNNCVDGSGRDAFALGYYVALAADASAATSRELHEATLQTADHAYATITDCASIVATWKSRHGAPPETSQ
jgi:ureidoacrylate peracid hydrolase